MPKKEQFLGFPRPTANHFPMPVIWIDICAYIDNISELKVVQYVLRHTWAAYEYQVVRRITVTEFMYGLLDPQTQLRIDSGTGLRSEQSVRTGLKKAIEHGFLICEEDRSNLANINKSYRLNLYEGDPQSLDLQPLEVQSLDPVYEVQSLDPQTLDLPASAQEVQTLDLIRKEYSIIRSRNSNTRAPKWLKVFAEDFSRDFHDDLHIGSNIKQLHNLYRESALPEEAFAELLYKAKAITQRASVRKKNPAGYPNRMPYFFRCLRGLLSENNGRSASGS